MYLVLSGTLFLIMLFTIAILFIVAVSAISKAFKKDKTKTKEEKIWEQLKENREDTSKNSSQ